MWRNRRCWNMCESGRSNWGWRNGELFIPQSYRWGQEGQVGWYEAPVEMDGEQVKANIFWLRSMATSERFIGPIHG